MTFLQYVLLVVVVYWLEADGRQNHPDIQNICDRANRCENSDQLQTNVEDVNNKICNFVKTECRSGNLTTAYLDKEFVNQFANANDTLLCTLLAGCSNDTKHVVHQTASYKEWHASNYSHHCPHSSFCGQPALLEIPDVMSGSLPCCQSCGCDPDCVLRHDCCYRNPVLQIESEKIECVEVETGFGHHTFQMITRCQDQSDCSKGGQIIRPVSSSATRRIYINDECAECNNAASYEHWEISFIADRNINLKTCLKTNNMQCGARYKIPKTHVRWLFKLLCEQTLQRNCAANFKDTRIIEACHDIRAPVLYLTMTGYLEVFANLYCVLCNNLRMVNSLRHYAANSYTRDDTYCFIDESYLAKDILTFSTLVDLSIVKASKGKANHKTMCEDKQQNTKKQCRPILCPEVKMRVNGQCKYFIKLWTSTRLSIQLKLRSYPGQKVESSLLQNMSVEDSLHVDRWLTNDCGMPLDTSPNRMIMVYMLSNNVNGIDVVEELIFRIQMYFKKTGNDIFSAMRRCVHGIWRVNRGEKTYSFFADFDKYATFVQNGISDRKLNVQPACTEPTLPKRYDRVTFGHIVDRGTFGHIALDMYTVVIKKLHFCDQIELNNDEIDILCGEIRIKRNGRILGDNEFHIDFTDNKRSFLVRVCLDDFMTLNGAMGVSTGKMDQWMKCIVVWFLAYTLAYPYRALY